MGSFGERLRREREKRSVTLESVSASTKIRTHNLEALEKEEFDKLPGGIFNKGFVRSYARFLGMNEDEVLKEFIAVAGDPEQPLPAPLVPRNPEIPQSKQRPPFARVAVIVMCAVVLLAGVSRGLRAVHRIAGPTWSHLRNARAQPAVIPSESLAKNNASSTSVEESRAFLATNQPENAVAATFQPASHTTTTPAPEAVPEPVSPKAGKFTLLVRAERPTWVSITADGKPVLEGVLKHKKKIHANFEVVLKSTDAAALSLSRNGKPLPPLGGEDQQTTVTVTLDRVSNQDSRQSAAAKGDPSYQAGPQTKEVQTNASH